MKKKNIDKEVVIAVVIAILIIQIAAMYFGINGTFRTFCIGLLALIAGVVTPKEVFTKWKK